MRKIFSLSLVLLAALAAVNCAHTPYPAVDTVYSYNRPYDFTYLAVLNAVEHLPDWKLSRTEKESGTITLHNTKYWDAFDADKREAIILVTRVDAKTTTVQFDPQSQKVVGGKDIMNEIDKGLKNFRQ